VERIRERRSKDGKRRASHAETESRRRKTTNLSQQQCLFPRTRSILFLHDSSLPSSVSAAHFESRAAVEGGTLRHSAGYLFTLVMNAKAAGPARKLPARPRARALHTCRAAAGPADVTRAGARARACSPRVHRGTCECRCQVSFARQRRRAPRGLVPRGVRTYKLAPSSDKHKRVSTTVIFI